MTMKNWGQMMNNYSVPKSVSHLFVNDHLTSINCLMQGNVNCHRAMALNSSLGSGCTQLTGASYDTANTIETY